MNHKTFYALLIALLFITAGTGCNKNDTPDNVYIPFSGPLVKTKTVTLGGNVTTTSYVYDDIGRVTRTTDNTYISYFTYTQQQVVVKTYQLSDTTIAPVVVTYTLNGQGLADNVNQFSFFTYDDNRQLLTENNTAANAVATYTYSNNNLITKTSNGSTFNYTYGRVITNTCGRENTGTGWLGKSSKLLPGTLQRTTNGNTDSYTYTYQNDSLSRITSITPTGTPPLPVEEYTYY